MGTRTGNPTWVDSATVAEAEANPSRKITAAKLNAIEDAIDDSAEAVHDHTAAQISDSTATGRAVLTAADAATARTAIGAGTSNLALGSTGSTAAAGDHTHTQYVPTSRTVAGKALSSDVTIGVADLSATGTRDGTTVLHGDNTWKVPAGGGGGGIDLPCNFPGPLSLPMGDYIGNSTMSLIAGRTYGQAFFVPRAVDVAALTVTVTTAAPSGGLARLALYKAHATNLNGTITDVADYGTVAIDTQGAKTATRGAGPAELDPGVWVVTVVADAGATLGCATVVGRGVGWMTLINVSNNWRGNRLLVNNVNNSGYVAGGMPSTHSLPDYAAAEGSGALMPALLDWTWA